MNMREWVIGIFLSMLCAWGPLSLAGAQPQKPAAVQPDANEASAREAFQRGRIHYDNGEFGLAAESFEQAYALSGRDALLYNLYLAYRDANQQEKAAEALSNYLTRVSVIENRAQLEARLKALQAGIAQRQQADEAQRAQDLTRAEQAKAAGPQAQSADAPAAPQAESGRWWLMPSVVMGAGAALMVGSIGTGVMARGKQKDLEKSCTNGVCDESLRATADSGKTLALVTDGLLFGGAAVAVGGLVWLLLKKPKVSGRPDVAGASLGCVARTCAGSLAVRF